MLYPAELRAQKRLKEPVGYWLGRRDSNPDTQIQSPFEVRTPQSDQQYTTVDHGELRQSPQCTRNAYAGENEAGEPPLAALRFWSGFARRGFDFEEDTLP